MKKISAIIFAAILLLSSCDSFFDINLEDQPTLEDIMSRPTAVKQFLAHLYAYIPRDEQTRDYEGGVVLRSDEALNAKSMYETYWYKVRRGEYGSDNTTSESSGNFWKRYYEGIKQCTTFMENLVYDKEDSPALVSCMAAEARFLRAYYYFVLFRQYGPIIIWMDDSGQAINPGTDIKGKDLDRNTLEECIEFMVRELDLAIKDLPVEISDVGESIASNKGRVTKGAAMALKTRILLYAASPLYNGQNGTGIYSSLMNKDGKKLFPDYDATKWQRAADAADSLIHMAGRPYQLTKVTAEGNTAIQNAAASYQNVWFGNWKVDGGTNHEVIWGWWYRSWADESLGSIGGDIAFCAPAGGKIALAGYSLSSPSLKLVDSYPMWETGRYPVLGYEKTGSMYDYSRPIVDEASGYSNTGWKEGYQQEIDVNSSWATPFKAHNSTVGRDARYYSCLVPNGFWWPSKTTYSGGPVRFTCYNSGEATSPYSATDACNRVGYVWRRLYKAGNPLKNYSDYINIRYVYPAFRLAEIFLDYAEACNEKPDRDAASAVAYVDSVRIRSGLKPLSTSYSEINFNDPGTVTTISGVSRTNKEWLRWIIQKERMVEFAFEGYRHYDACRWMTAQDEYPVENWTLHVTADNYEDSYERVCTDYIGGRAVFSSRDYLFPFGSAQIAEMTNFTQNPGW